MSLMVDGRFSSHSTSDLRPESLRAFLERAVAATRFLEPYPDAEVILGDVLASKSQLAPYVLERLPDHSDWALCSNLPYSISGPFLATVAQLDHPPGRVCCLVQKEVAERIVAAAAELWQEKNGSAGARSPVEGQAK